MTPRPENIVALLILPLIRTTEKKKITPQTMKTKRFKELQGIPKSNQTTVLLFVVFKSGLCIGHQQQSSSNLSVSIEKNTESAMSLS
jgi:hypothetical protein